MLAKPPIGASISKIKIFVASGSLSQATLSAIAADREDDRNPNSQYSVKFSGTVILFNPRKNFAGAFCEDG